jgi:uncharacterized membrane protein (UPF0127 family)
VTPTSAILLVDGRPVAPVAIAVTRLDRARGLLGATEVDGALLLERTRSVHSIGMAFALDVACCDAEGRVLRAVYLRPGRVLLPRRRVRSILEAEAGAFARWGVAIGSRLEVGES